LERLAAGSRWRSAVIGPRKVRGLAWGEVCLRAGGSVPNSALSAKGIFHLRNEHGKNKKLTKGENHEL